MCLAATGYGSDVDGTVAQVAGGSMTVPAGLGALATLTDQYVAELNAMERPNEVAPYHRTYIANVSQLNDRLRSGQLTLADVPSLNFTTQYPAVPQDIGAKLVAAAELSTACGPISLLSSGQLRTTSAASTPSGTPSSGGGSTTPSPPAATASPQPASNVGNYRTYVGDMCREAIDFGADVTNAAAEIVSMRIRDPRNEFPEKMEPAFSAYLAALRAMSPPDAVDAAHSTYISRLEGRLASMRSGALGPVDAARDFEREFSPLPGEQVQLLLAHPDATPLCEESRFFHT
jgi:hypothetical protein